MATDERLAARLKEARLAAGFTSAADAARAIGVPEPTYASHENGTRGFRANSAATYARRFRVSLEWLLTGKGTNRQSDPALSAPQSFGEMPAAPVIGTVEAGAWREAVAIEHSEDFIRFVPHPAFPAEQQMAMRVSGPSCNRVVQDGGFAIVVPYDAVPGGIDALVLRDEPPLVIFERERSGTYEYTMKSLVRGAKGFELRPVSDHPAHQQVVQLNENGDTSHVRIAFVVIQTLNNVF